MPRFSEKLLWNSQWKKWKLKKGQKKGEQRARRKLR